MALTRKLLKGMGLTEEQVDTLIEAHAETVDALKEEVAKFKAEAEKLPEVQKELDALKSAKDDGYAEKYDALKTEYDNYKSEIQSRDAKTAKEKAVRAYYESRDITGKSLDIAMRGSSAEIDAVEIEDGKIKDTAALDELINGTFSGLVSKTTVTGAKTDTPPTNSGGRTKEEILAIKDAGERQRAIAENHELFNF